MRKSPLAADRFTMLENTPVNCEVIFDRHVFEYILYELRRHPNSEEGGKYIGYLEGGKDAEASGSRYRVVITDFLPGGPNAKRTAVEFFPDGDFQEGLFRQAERRDRSIEHLGTWHSHHCNGLDRLSEGDIAGYFKTVNKAAYRPDVFVVSLVKYIPQSSHDRGWIDHFLFIRNDDQFYKITGNVSIMDALSSFADITGHAMRAEPTQHGASQWHETEIGRSILGEDKRFFTEHFGQNIRATRRDGIIAMTCSTGPKTMAVSYPGSREDREVKINVASSGRTILAIQCDYADRQIAYAASFSALDLL